MSHQTSIKWVFPDTEEPFHTKVLGCNPAYGRTTGEIHKQNTPGNGNSGHNSRNEQGQD